MPRTQSIPLVALVLLLPLGGCDREASAPPPVPPGGPPRAGAEPPRPPAVRFVEITAEAGLSFTHCNGASAEKLLPETMGSGCAFLDYDGDGDQDILLVNQRPWPPSTDPACTQALYRNDGTGHFTDATAEAGLDVSLLGMGIVVGDYDNDGDPDLYFTTVSGGRLLRNDAGRFVDVTAAANASAGSGWLTSGAFFDLENDGDLDLFLCSYVQWSAAADHAQPRQIAGVGLAYAPPSAFPGAFCVLLRNDGDGTFTDISEPSGIRLASPERGVPLAKSLGVAPFDINGDGFVDLAVANDTTRNFLFRNRGDGTFEELGILAGVSFDQAGSVRGAMGIDWAHFRNDAALGLAIANFANEMTALYVADDPKTFDFVDLANVVGLGAATQPPLKFGLFFLDYDLDGRLDLLTANGHLEPEIARAQAGESYRQPAQLFWNSGEAGQPLFLPVGPETAGPDLFTPIVGRGSSYADIDGDGDLDVLVTANGGPARLLRNEGGDKNHWLRLRLVGRASNREAIGARVLFKAGPHESRRQLFPAKGYLSSVELPLTFGLGTADQADTVTITWPSGKVSEFAQLPAGTAHVIDEEAGLQP